MIKTLGLSVLLMVAGCAKENPVNNNGPVRVYHVAPMTIHVMPLARLREVHRKVGGVNTEKVLAFALRREREIYVPWDDDGKIDFECLGHEVSHMDDVWGCWHDDNMVMNAHGKAQTGPHRKSNFILSPLWAISSATTYITASLVSRSYVCTTELIQSMRDVEAYLPCEDEAIAVKRFRNMLARLEEGRNP